MKSGHYYRQPNKMEEILPRQKRHKEMCKDIIANYGIIFLICMGLISLNYMDSGIFFLPCTNFFRELWGALKKSIGVEPNICPIGFFPCLIQSVSKLFLLICEYFVLFCRNLPIPLPISSVIITNWFHLPIPIPLPLQKSVQNICRSVLPPN